MSESVKVITPSDQNLLSSPKIHGLLYREFYQGEHDLLLDRSTIQTLVLE